MKKTGKILKSAREQAKLTLKEISSTTKINIRMLQAIEEGREEDLPPATFLRGFIKTYSTYLKLDPNEIMNIYKEELNPTLAHADSETATTPEAPVASTYRKEIKDNQFDWSFLKDRSFVMKTLTGVAIVSLLCFVFLVKNIIQKYEREQQITSPPQKINTINADKPSGEVFNSDVLSEKEVVKENPKPKEVVEKPKLKKVEEPASPSAIEVVEVKKIKPPEPNKNSDEELKKVAEIQKTKIKPPKEEKPEPKKPTFKQEIILEALDKVSVKMVLDNNTTRRITLNPSQVHIIKANQMIELEVSDGGAINLIHNGRDRGVPGDLGSGFKKTYQ